MRDSAIGASRVGETSVSLTGVVWGHTRQVFSGQAAPDFGAACHRQVSQHSRSRMRVRLCGP